MNEATSVMEPATSFAEILGENLPMSAAIEKSDIAEYKRCIQAGHETLARDFDSGRDVREIVGARAAFIDEVLNHIWSRSKLADSPHALLAVGGYGRGELHPYSDIDIAILLKKRLSKDNSKEVERFVTFLWDIGLEVGHSVRTVKQCVASADDDLTIMTNLMEARLICGSTVLVDELKKKISPKKIWSTEKFFAAKLEEQTARHAKFNDAFQVLEPNIKESPGGMRDIQVIAWTANRHFDARDLSGLVDKGFLTEDEGHALLSGEAFLWKVRCALHFTAGRREDRLLFEHQKTIALTLGYADDGANQAVENFMKDYYRTVRELASLNEMLLGLFREAILETGRAKVAPLNRRFQIRNNAIEISDEHIFTRSPTAILEIFLLLQQHPEIIGIRASTIRELRRHLYLIDEEFRSDLRARSLFMEIIRQPRRIGHELQRMHRFGVLGAYLPVFSAVEGLMQFDLFHIYTVDEHTLFVVRNMRFFSFPRSETDQPALVREVVATLPKLELLYIAGLFHDIAKGRGGDHSELGAEEAVNFCRAHGLSNMDTHLVAWLVRRHLLMSSTAQRKDIYDAAVIKDFAREVGDQLHLDYLFLLTVADIRGTNPELWNGWKESLLSELYVATRRMLHRGADSPDEQREKIANAKSDARQLLADRNYPGNDIDLLWDSLGDNYFIRHRADEIAWHTDAVLSTDKSELPIVAVRNDSERGSSSVFVYDKDVDGLFALTTAALDNLRLDVQDARIITSKAGYTLDTYTVIDTNSGRSIELPERIEEIRARITSAIRTGEVPAPSLSHAASRRIKNFNIPVSVHFEFDKAHNCTVMEVIATDRPGALSKIGGALAQCNIRLHDARIATFGAQIEDYFYITTKKNQKLNAESDIPQLKQCVVDALRME